MGSNCAECPGRKRERCERPAIGQHVECEFAWARFRDAAHRARSGRRLRLQRIGLHGRISRCVACVAGDGIADGARAVRCSILAR